MGLVEAGLFLATFYRAENVDYFYILGGVVSALVRL